MHFAACAPLPRALQRNRPWHISCHLLPDLSTASEFSGEGHLETSTGRASIPSFSTWLSSQNCKRQQQKLVTTVVITGVMMVCSSTLTIEFGHHSIARKCKHLQWDRHPLETDLPSLEAIEALCVLSFPMQRPRSLHCLNTFESQKLVKDGSEDGSEGVQIVLKASFPKQVNAVISRPLSLRSQLIYAVCAHPLWVHCKQLLQGNLWCPWAV